MSAIKVMPPALADVSAPSISTEFTIKLTPFDQRQYRKLTAARAETIRRVAEKLKAAMRLETALEPGDKYFLGDALAPSRGELLDIGCGTGNFLAAARDAGYTVTGTELGRNAARFAKQQLGLLRILGLTISEFAEKYPGDKFDVITFFEVLEHQTAPVEFVEKVKSCQRPRGYIALSVPNRERWLTGPDVLDYPPTFSCDGMPERYEVY